MNDKNKGLFVLTDEDCPIDVNKLAIAVYDELAQTDSLSIELAFISGEEIRQLNREQRGIDSITDVLSFPYLDEIRHKVILSEEFSDDIDEEGRVLIGSVCICVERAKEQAKEYGHSLQRELNYLATHGFLHCFGYDHMTGEDEEEMTAIAERIMNRIGLARGEI